MCKIIIMHLLSPPIIFQQTSKNMKRGAKQSLEKEFAALLSRHFSFSTSRNHASSKKKLLLYRDDFTSHTAGEWMRRKVCIVIQQEFCVQRDDNLALIAKWRLNGSTSFASHHQRNQRGFGTWMATDCTASPVAPATPRSLAPYVIIIIIIKWIVWLSVGARVPGLGACCDAARSSSTCVCFHRQTRVICQHFPPTHTRRLSQAILHRALGVRVRQSFVAVNNDRQSMHHSLFVLVHGKQEEILRLALSAAQKGWLCTGA